MDPFARFRLNEAPDDSAEIAAILQAQAPELAQALRTRQPPTSSTTALQDSKTTTGQLEVGVREFLARQAAAAALGLQRGEFAAITGETFVPGWFADLLLRNSPVGDDATPAKIGVGCPWTAATLWGYASTEEMLGPESGCRLELVKAQLLPRSGLQLPDVSELARSRLFEQALVVVGKHGDDGFASSPEDLRLRTRSAAPHGGDALSERVCFGLQAFLRLRARLQWTTGDLDAAMALLRAREARTKPVPAPPASDTLSPISPYVVKEIASIVQLRDLTAVHPASLLPLWGPLDTHGEDSFFSRTFLRRSHPAMSRVFVDLRDSNPSITEAAAAPLVRDHTAAVCAVLRWPASHYADLLEAAGLDAAGETLSMQALAALHRHALLCQILGVSPRSCVRFFALFYARSKMETPLDSPTATLVAVREWQRLFEDGWDVETVYGLLRGGKEEVAAVGRTGDGGDEGGARSVSGGGAQEVKDAFPLLFG